MYEPAFVIHHIPTIPFLPGSPIMQVIEIGNGKVLTPKSKFQSCKRVRHINLLGGLASAGRTTICRRKLRRKIRMICRRNFDAKYGSSVDETSPQNTDHLWTNFAAKYGSKGWCQK
eukprot:g31432.t1